MNKLRRNMLNTIEDDEDTAVEEAELKAKMQEDMNPSFGDYVADHAPIAGSARREAKRQRFERLKYIMENKGKK